MYLTPIIEKKIISIFCSALIIMDLIVIYFIIDLLNYDEIIGYISIDKIKRCNTRPIAFLFLVATLANLLFVMIYMMSVFLSNYFAKCDASK
jgi:hypothetical protein